MSDQNPSGSAPPGQPSTPGMTELGCAAEVRPPRPDEVLSARAWRDDRKLSIESIALAVLAALALASAGGAYLIAGRPQPLGAGAVATVVERIIAVESNGDPNARNKRSSATGAAQFIDETWLEMIRTYRRDLIAAYREKEILELRRDPELTRAIMTRSVEQHAAMLKRRGLPVTPGTLYLTHFAGPAGAVAVLSVSDYADAASLMA